MRRALLILCAICFALAAQAADPNTAFLDANKLYEQGRYDVAAAAYQKILKESGASPVLYFNMGNALFKKGQVGRAVYFFRLAEQLAPRDPDLRANLHFARDTVTGSSTAPRRTEWLSYLTLNEWTWIAIAALWGWFILLFAREIKPELKRSLAGYTAAAGVATVLLGVLLALAFIVSHSRREAIIVTREAVARLGPLEESQSAFTARDGAEFPILAEAGDWLQVRDAANHLGWLPRRNVLIFPPQQ